MLRPMESRGPDRHSLTCAGEAGFAHALLATTPEAMVEMQPWRHPESGCLVVADSRLDNRAQLLSALGIDRPADSIGDCELLHTACQRWGSDCPERLRGDFAFAVWDPAQRELFVARDPMGVRPFAFHFTDGELFVFGSTADIVLAQGQVPTDLDEGRIADALIGETEGIDQVCTFYKAIRRLPPAHWMRLRASRLEQCRYWQPVGKLPPLGLPRTEQEWIDAQREHLDRAVRLRLRSNRPVGAMLSGGLDSSSVVALAALQQANHGLPPFPVFAAIDSNNPDCTETRHARTVASHVRCMPTWIDLPAFERAPDNRPTWWDAGVEPFDSGMSMLAELYRNARLQGVVSMLDGTPADNIYSGGRQVQLLFRRGDWMGAWHAAISQNRSATHTRSGALRTMAGAVVPDGVHALRQWLRDRHDFRHLLKRSPVSDSLADRAGLWQRYRRYRHGIISSHQMHPSGDATSSISVAYITAAIERYNRVASLFGVEPRHPFSDRDLIEFQAWMPISMRLRDGHRKWVLRQAMANDLPEAVCWRTDKSHLGWRFTRAQVQRSSSSPAGLDTARLADWVTLPGSAECEAEKSRNHASSRLFPAFALERWLRSRDALRREGGADGMPRS